MRLLRKILAVSFDCLSEVFDILAQACVVQEDPQELADLASNNGSSAGSSLHLDKEHPHDSTPMD